MSYKPRALLLHDLEPKVHIPLDDVGNYTGAEFSTYTLQYNILYVIRDCVMEYNNIHHVSWTHHFCWWVGSDFDVNQPTSYQITVVPSHLCFNPLRPIFGPWHSPRRSSWTSRAWTFFRRNSTLATLDPVQYKAGASVFTRAKCLTSHILLRFTSFHIQARLQGQTSIHEPKHKTTNIQREKKVLVKSCSTSLPTEDHSINPQRLRRKLKVEENHLQKHPTN